LFGYLGNELNELRNDPNFTGKERDVSQLISCILAGDCDAIFDSLSRSIVVNSLKIKGRKSKRLRKEEDNEVEAQIQKEEAATSNKKEKKKGLKGEKTKKKSKKIKKK